tara:strand:+ start:5368 stop:6246 length:879 start_codon:yes stop_codon:yes gene_type:complete
MGEINNDLKKTFSTIKDLRENSCNILIDIRDKLNILENTYKELLEFNSDENSTGLDYLYFQNKLFEMQLVNNNNIFVIINNRIYGNYYKLYKEIYKYILSQKYSLKDSEIKEFPVYKDLDNDEKYDFKVVIEIYNYIIQLLDILDNEVIHRKNKFNKQLIHRDCGLNIENLLDSITYVSSLLEKKVDLFNSNINNINKFHIKYLTRFHNSSKFFYKQLNNDVNIEKKNLQILSDSNSDSSELSESIANSYDNNEDIKNFENEENDENHEELVNIFINENDNLLLKKYFCNII